MKATLENLTAEAALLAALLVVGSNLPAAERRAVAGTSATAGQCAAAEAKLCGSSRHGGTQPTDCIVCVGLHISELAAAGCTDADVQSFCNPVLDFGGGKLHFQFDETFSLRSITTTKGGRQASNLLFATTPLWQVTTTDCTTVFPAGEPVSSQFVSNDVRRSYYLTESPSNYTVHFRWEHVDIGSVAGMGNSSQQIAVEIRMTLASPEPVGPEPGIAHFTGSVRAPAGVCVQSFTLLDLRGLVWNPENGDRMFIPYEQGSVSDCGRSDPGPCSQWVDADEPGGSASFPEILGAGRVRLPQCANGGRGCGVRSEQPWTPGGSTTMGWRALTLAGNGNRTRPVALYLAAHDPIGRMKMLVATAALTNSKNKGALMRVIHVPDSLIDSQPSNWTIPYPTVLAITDGDWWDSSQIYRKWVLGNARWATRGPLRAQVSKGLLPQWVVDAPFCTRANGNCEYPQGKQSLKCADKMIRLKALLGGVPMMVHWYGWNAEAFDTRYPHYTPIDGVDKEVSKLQAEHIQVYPYTNGRLMDPSLPDWATDHAIQYACGCFDPNVTQPDPRMVPTDSCDATGAPGFYREVVSSGRGLAVMDPTTEYYQHKIALASAKVISDIGASGLYVDELGASHALRCFQDSNSDRGGGGGSAWSEGTRQLLRTVNEATTQARGGEPVPIISEAMNEQWLGLVPMNLAIYNHEYTSHCTSVPAYQAIYGGWAVNVGDNRYPWSSRANRTREHWVGMQRGMVAQAFVEGSVMGWMALEELAMWMNNASHSDDIGFFRTLSHLRVAAVEFLVHGRLWRPPAVHTLPPATTLVCDFGTIGSTAPIEPAMCCNVSNALVSAWANQNGTQIGVAMVNHGVELAQLVVDIALPPALQSKKTLIGRSLGSTGSVTTTIPAERSADGTSAQLRHKLSGLTGAVFELLCP